MMLWYVECEDLSCVWDTKKQAIDYFKGEVKRCEQEYYLVDGDDDINNDNFVIYSIAYFDENGIKHGGGEVAIYQICYNEKPYID